MAASASRNRSFGDIPVSFTQPDGWENADWAVIKGDPIFGLVFMEVSDAGLPFDPRDAVFEGPNLERGGGAGLELIRAWSRIADYTRRAGRNRLFVEMPLG